MSQISEKYVIWKKQHAFQIDSYSATIFLHQRNQESEVLKMDQTEVFVPI